jgi:chemotaxis regulatin CheY-phosphate phosphatase CheZ
LFPVALPVVAATGAAGLGAWFGHLAHGTSRGEARRIGAMLNEGDSAVVVVGIDHDAEQVESAAAHARDHVLNRSVGDWDEAENDALEAVKQAEAARA